MVLRISNLFSIKFSDIEHVGQAFYLPVKTIKTGKLVRIKLPEYAIRIIENLKKRQEEGKLYFHQYTLQHLISTLKKWQNQWVGAMNWARADQRVD